MIHFRATVPDFSNVHEFEYDWEKLVYGKLWGDIPPDVPPALGKQFTLSHYADTNLFYNITSGRSVPSILHLINQTPIVWYTKKQATVETATYGSELWQQECVLNK